MPDPSHPEHGPSRRRFLRDSGLAAAAVMFTGSSLMRAASPPPADVVTDTYAALLAFVVPGDDPYSRHQGVAAETAGGPGAGVVPQMVADLDSVLPLPNFSAFVAGVLNNTALLVNPGSAAGPFVAPFANLGFVDKARVFGGLEADPQAGPLASALLQLAAFLAYSEAGVFDPTSGQLTGWPVGWQRSGYAGVVAGHADLQGYFENQRSAR